MGVFLNVVLFIGIVAVMSSSNSDALATPMRQMVRNAPAMGRAVRAGNQCLRVMGRNPFENVRVNAIHAPMTAAATYKITLETPEGTSVIECPDDTYVLDKAGKKDLTFLTRAVLVLALPAPVRLPLDPSTSPTSLSLRTPRLLMASFLPALPTLPLMLPSRLTWKGNSSKLRTCCFAHR